MLLQRVDNDTDDERQIGQFLSRLLFEARTYFLAQARYAGEIDLEKRRDVRGMPARHDHMVARQLPDLRHRLDGIARPRLDGRTVCADARRSVQRPSSGGGGARFEILQDVSLGDSSGDSRSVHPGDLDAVFGGNLANERRRLRAEPILERVAIT